MKSFGFDVLNKFPLSHNGSCQTIVFVLFGLDSSSTVVSS